MKRDYPDRPLVGVGAVIVHGDRVVIVQRGTEPLKGQWSIPGGALEVGETLRECAEREAEEETGLLIEATDVLDVFDAIHIEAGGRIRYHYVLIDFKCRSLDGCETSWPELKAGGDALQAKWVTCEELEIYNVAETARQVIRKAFAKS